jgi:hypothetical protein
LRLEIFLCPDFSLLAAGAILRYSLVLKSYQEYSQIPASLSSIQGLTVIMGSQTATNAFPSIRACIFDMYVSGEHFSSYSGMSQEELLLVPLKTLSPFIFSSKIGSRDMLGSNNSNNSLPKEVIANSPLTNRDGLLINTVIIHPNTISTLY